MTKGFYTIATALDARFKAQDVIAQNLASVETQGYRKQVPGFVGFGEALRDAEQSSRDHAHGAGVRLEPPSWDMTAGPLRETGRELDFAIRGKGFFVVRTPHGEMLTRDGHFQVSQDNQLVTTNGLQVLGRNGEIHLPQGKVSVRDDGTILVDGQPAGEVRIEEPAGHYTLTTEGGALFAVSGSGGTRKVSDAQVVGGAVELSNVNVPAEMVAMISNSRMADTAGRSLQIMDETIGKAISSMGA